MTKYKAIIIGCGKIAGIYDDVNDTYVYSHAKAYISNANISLDGCSDLNLDNAKKLSNKYNIPLVNDNYLVMIQDIKPDIISVCTPDKTHYSITKEILDQKYLPSIIFLEKPACQNKNELKELINLSDEKNVKILVNHSRRFDTLHKELKYKVSNNEFGRLIKADAVYYSGWQHNGVHIIDTLNFLFEDELIIESLLNRKHSPYDDDYNLDFKCKFKNIDALVYLTTMDENYYQLFEFDFKFEKARIRLEDFGNRISYEVKTTNNMNENILIKCKLGIGEDKRSPMQLAIETIVDSLRNNNSLKGYLIDDISQTMQIIWEGNKWLK